MAYCVSEKKCKDKFNGNGFPECTRSEDCEFKIEDHDKAKIYLLLKKEIKKALNAMKISQKGTW